MLGCASEEATVGKGFGSVFPSMAGVMSGFWREFISGELIVFWLFEPTPVLHIACVYVGCCCIGWEGRNWGQFACVGCIPTLLLSFTLSPSFFLSPSPLPKLSLSLSLSLSLPSLLVLSLCLSVSFSLSCSCSRSFSRFVCIGVYRP